MSTRVEPFAGTPEEWDTFVRAGTGWSHFHLYGWRGVIERTHGHRCPYLAVRGSAGELVGVLPLVEVASPFFGRYLVSMPFFNYGGPLGSDEAVRALAGEAAALAKSRRAKLLELRSRHQLPLDLPVSHRKITVLLDIPAGGSAALWDSLKPKLRSQVRRPQKEGITVRFGADQVAPFYQVFAHHMRDLGTPVQSRKLFDEIIRAFPDDAWFGCAWLNDQPIACGAGFAWNGELEMTWASSLVAFNKMAPNMLVYWAFMERAADAGIKVFNFGRCSPGSGTHRFKQQWGTRDQELWWYQQPGGEAAGTPSPDDAAYAWGPRIWKKLPLGLANALGPLVVRGIP